MHRIVGSRGRQVAQHDFDVILGRPFRDVGAAKVCRIELAASHFMVPFITVSPNVVLLSGDVPRLGCCQREQQDCESGNHGNQEKGRVSNQHSRPLSFPLFLHTRLSQNGKGCASHHSKETNVDFASVFFQ